MVKQLLDYLIIDSSETDSEENTQIPCIDSIPLSNLCPGKLLEVWQPLEKCEPQEVCFTFKPQYHTMNITHLHNKFKDYILAFMKKQAYFKPSYVFVPEFTSSGNLHYHAIVYFENASYYWVAELKRKCGTKWGLTVGKTVFNLANYVTYICKDINKAKFTIQPFYKHPV